MPEREAPAMSFANAATLARLGSGGGLHEVAPPGFEALGPFAGPVFLPRPSVFLASDPAPEWLVRNSPVICRDGVLPMLAWLRRHDPATLPVKLLLPWSARAFVPERWREKAGFFRLRSLASAKPERILLTGVVHPLFSSPRELARRLEELSPLAAIEGQWPEVLVSFTLPRQIEEPGLFWEFNRVLGRALGGSYTVLPIEEALLRVPGAGTLLCEVNNGHWLGDSAVQHQLLAKGCSLALEAADQAKVLPVSAFHGVELLSDVMRCVHVPGEEEEKESRALAQLLPARAAGAWEPWLECWLGGLENRI